jgi:hypothetical protein
VPANARPWCKYLTLANTLAYYDTTTIIYLKHFIVQIFGALKNFFVMIINPTQVSSALLLHLRLIYTIRFQKLGVKKFFF